MASTRMKASIGAVGANKGISTPGNKDIRPKMGVTAMSSSTAKVGPKSLVSLKKNVQNGSSSSLASSAKGKGSVVATISSRTKKFPATSAVSNKGGVLGSNKGNDAATSDFYSNRKNENEESSETSSQQDLNGNGNFGTIHHGETSTANAVMNLEMKGPPAVPQEDLNTKMKRFLSTQLKSSSEPNLGVRGRPPVASTAPLKLKAQPAEPPKTPVNAQPPLPSTCEPNCSGLHFCLKLPSGLTLQPLMCGQGQATLPGATIRPISEQAFGPMKAMSPSQGSPTFFNSVIGDMMSIRSMALNSGICTVDDSQAIAKVEGLIMRVLAFKDAEQDVPKLMQP